MKLALFGSPLDTGNFGVSALGVSTVAALDCRLPAMDLTLFDGGTGARPGSIELNDRFVTLTLRGAWPSRRVYRPESLWTTYAAARSGLPINANLRVIDSSDAVLDVSGGDSFSDIYGAKRFAAVMLPKRIVLQRGRPLILLPQTYGPFGQRSSFLAAQEVVRRATDVWARDEDSFERLRELAGADFDRGTYHQGVDLAFGLPSREPRGVDSLRDWFEDDVPVAGLNVSGLLTNQPQDAAERFGLRIDYAAAMEKFIGKLLRDGVRVLLAPHVRGGNSETDDRACAQMVERLGQTPNLRTLPPGLDASETKWMIAQTSWFAGARMHATIAALSSSVPAAVIAYSDKARGVFASCGLAREVFDARTLGTDELCDALFDAWQRRDATRGIMAESVPGVLQAANEQADRIATTLRQQMIVRSE